MPTFLKRVQDGALNKMFLQTRKGLPALLFPRLDIEFDRPDHIFR